MQRYFVDIAHKENDTFILVGDDYHHISRVMRMKLDDQMTCVTNEGKSARCTIIEMTEASVVVSIDEWNDEVTELPIRVTLANGIPKGDKLDWIVQKGTELGATAFIPFQAAHSISKWDKKKSLKKVARLQKIAKEAAEQSYRLCLPIVHGPASLNEIIAESTSSDYKIIAFEEEAKKGEQSTLAHVLNNITAGESLFVVFGPEGGLTSTEVQLLEENGFQSCGLGPRILRTETAPLYVLAAASYQLELSR